MKTFQPLAVGELIYPIKQTLLDRDSKSPKEIATGQKDFSCSGYLLNQSNESVRSIALSLISYKRCLPCTRVHAHTHTSLMEEKQMQSIGH